MEQFTKMLKDFKVLDKHLKGHVEAKIEPDVLEPIDQLKVEHDSDSNNSQNDFDEDGDGFEEDLNTAEPKKKSLLAEVLAESPIQHSKEFMEKKVARLQALT